MLEAVSLNQAMCRHQVGALGDAPIPFLEQARLPFRGEYWSCGVRFSSSVFVLGDLAYLVMLGENLS